MKEVTAEGEDEGQHSDLSPYHSDSDSAVMMSGNSPYISKVRGFVIQIMFTKLRDKGKQIGKCFWLSSTGS